MTVTTIAAVRERCRVGAPQAQRVVFVPTMGNLHPGTSASSSCAQARRSFRRQHFREPDAVRAERGFRALSAHADDGREDARRGRVRSHVHAGCRRDLSERADHDTRVAVPGISGVLDGEFRPGHFDGVSTIVAKLFNIVTPDVAMFGEKDFQQLTMIRRMVADLCLPVEIVGAPTVRETDGLAMSSRNQYLDETQRKLAPTIYRQLQQAVAALESGSREYATIEAAGRAALDGAGSAPTTSACATRNRSRPRSRIPGNSWS